MSTAMYVASPPQPSCRRTVGDRDRGRRLVFRTLTGKTIEVPVDAITGVREATVFKGSVVGGQTHLIVQTAAGEIGFYVFSGIDGWMAALQQTA
jgi:hypothetical protein